MSSTHTGRVDWRLLPRAAAYLALAAWILVGCERLAGADLGGRIVEPLGASPQGHYSAFLASYVSPDATEIWIAPAGMPWDSGWRSLRLVSGTVEAARWQGPHVFVITLGERARFQEFRSALEPWVRGVTPLQVRIVIR
jgi:hypothetical protein